MENKEIPTLEQKQAFWAEQLPNFEAKYWLPSHFEFLTFDIEQGNYVIKDDLDPSFDDDATEIWHRVNTGWAMWKKAIKFTEQKATPEGFILVPKDELTTTYYWEGAEYAVSCVSEYEMELENGEIVELEKLEQTKSTKAFFANIYSDEDNFEIVEFDSIEAAQQAIKENKAMIEAQEQSHELD